MAAPAGTEAHRTHPATAESARLVTGWARLAFSVSPAHHEGEDWDLAVMNADGGGYRKLTTGPGNDRVPDWKP